MTLKISIHMQEMIIQLLTSPMYMCGFLYISSPIPWLSLLEHSFLQKKIGIFNFMLDTMLCMSTLGLGHSTMCAALAFIRAVTAISPASLSVMEGGGGGGR